MTDAAIMAASRVLLVEDEYFVADDLAHALEEIGAVVVGPVGRVDDALSLIAATERLDGAVLDLNLQGEMAYPIADALAERGVPFVFATGYDRSAIPPRYGAVKRCEKPVDAMQVSRALFG